MPRANPNVLELAERFRLGLERVPPRGPAGERLGKASGASLEFQDRRAYQLGDDVRHVDWRALARSDQLVVRLWREEVLARVEILLDVSRSMALDPRKAELALDLTTLFAAAARADGAQVQLIALGERPRLVEFEELLATGLEFEARVPLAEALPSAEDLRRHGSVCLVVSDFLFPHDPRELVRSLGRKAGVLALVQVLAEFENDPPIGSARRLVDCESDAALDLVLDRATVTRYRSRLKNLTAGLEQECRRAQARFSTLVADRSLEEIVRAELVASGLIWPRKA
jgi:uncharacterized protein (DUF58 family)